MFNCEQYRLRSKCQKCGSEFGIIKTTNGQDTVFCSCGKYQYCAPKTETGREQRTVRTRENLKPKIRFKILERASGRCELCGKDISQSGLHVDHILPVEEKDLLGMTDDELQSEDNLGAFCDECNLGKGKQLIRPMVLLKLIRRRKQTNELNTPRTKSPASVGSVEARNARK